MGVLVHPYRSALLFAVSLVSPALAAAQAEETPVPWAVEAPRAAKSRFGLGLELFFERQESLQIVRLERTIRERDVASGNEEIGIFREDRALLNRKFDLLLELEGVGSELAVALPSIGTPGAFQLFQTVVVQAAWADVQLDFHDRTRAGDSTSYEGQGPLFTTGVDLTAVLCRSCSWFAGTSYRFQKLPSLNVDRSPPFAPSGFAVLDDDVRLAREVQEISTSVGYSFPGNRFASYLGVRHRWTDLEIEDDLRYRDPLGRTETSLSSHTDLESEVTLALAGIEAHLGGRFYGRIETAISDEDRGAWMQVVYLPRREKKTDVTKDENAQEAEEAHAIAARIRSIRADFVKAVDALPELVEVATIEALLSQTEDRLIEALPFPEFAAMQDWVRDQFRSARDLLPTNTAAFSPEVARRPLRLIELGSSGFAPAVNRLTQGVRRKEEVGAWKYVQDIFDRLVELFENNDILLDLCVRTEPDAGADVTLYPASYPDGGGTVQSNGRSQFPRGLYAYTVSSVGLQFSCTGSGCRPLDLVKEDRPLVYCLPSNRQCYVGEEPSGRWDCKADER